MKLKNILFGLSVLSLLVSGSTSEAQGRLYSLSDYIGAALRSNPLVASATQASLSAEYSDKSLRKGFYPQIGIGSHFIFAPGYDEAVTNGGEFGAQLSGSYMLYDGGAKSLQMLRSGAGVEEGKLNQSRTRADIVYSVSIAYVGAVKQKRELAVVEQEYDLLRDYLQLVKQLHAAARGSETDVLKTTVDVNNAEIDINARRVAYANALISLAEGAGLPTEEVTDVDTSMTDIGFDSTFDAQRNVELKSQELVLSQAELDAQIAGARLRPTVSLAADAGALTSLPNLQQGLANVFGASVGISVSMPVFTFGSVSDGVSAAEANARSISLQNSYTRSVLEREFQSTRNEIASADSQIAALGKNLEVADQNLLLSRAQYAGGTGLSLEVLNAIQMVNQLRLSLEEVKAGREMSILKLNRLNYTGAN
jgi:outer membrane protein TolC